MAASASDAQADPAPAHSRPTFSVCRDNNPALIRRILESRGYAEGEQAPGSAATKVANFQWAQNHLGVRAPPCAGEGEAESGGYFANQVGIEISVNLNYGELNNTTSTWDVP